METARLIQTATNGSKAESESVVLVCTTEEAAALFSALDLLCTEQGKISKRTKIYQTAVKLYHSLGWNSDLMEK